MKIWFDFPTKNIYGYIRKKIEINLVRPGFIFGFLATFVKSPKSIIFIKGLRNELSEACFFPRFKVE